MSRPKMPSRWNYIIDKGVDVALYVTIDAVSIYLTNHTFSLSSLPLDSLLLVLVLIGIAALVITYAVASPIHKKIDQKRLVEKTGGVESKEAIQGLDLRREEDRPKIDSLLDEAERGSTVWVLGIDCAYWLDDYRGKVREYVTGRDHDLSITFLVAKPDSVILETASEAKLTSPGSKGRIEKAISLFQEMKSELGEKGGKIRLGIYDLPLVHSMVVVNPNTSVERIQVTHYLYKMNWVDIPNLTLRRQFLTKPQQAVFDAYHGSIKHVLENARDLDGKPLVSEIQGNEQPRKAFEPPSLKKSQAIYGADVLLELLENLESKGRQWQALLAGVPQEKDLSLVEREAYSYRSDLLNKSAYYGDAWDTALQYKIHTVYDELEKAASALEKKATDYGKAHIETALDIVRSLISYLKPRTTN
jgi:hypothetical protein